MAQVLDYDFDKTHIKNSSYSPMAHGTIEEEQRQLRVGLLEVLAGQRSIPITLSNPAPAPISIIKTSAPGTPQ
jgi:hypothetical protein